MLHFHKTKFHGMNIFKRSFDKRGNIDCITGSISINRLATIRSMAWKIKLITIINTELNVTNIIYKYFHRSKIIQQLTILTYTNFYKRSEKNKISRNLKDPVNDAFKIIKGRIR